MQPQSDKDFRFLARMSVWICVRVVLGFTLLTLFSREGWMCPDMTLIECLFVTW